MAMNVEQVVTETQDRITGITLFQASPLHLPSEYCRARTVNERLRVAMAARLNGNRALANMALYDSFFQVASASEAQEVQREAIAQGNGYLAKRAGAWRRPA